ncbi:MAG: hypothetical protein ACRCX2_03815 [Paraclostridium sp.]
MYILICSKCKSKELYKDGELYFCMNCNSEIDYLDLDTIKE